MLKTNSDHFLKELLKCSYLSSEIKTSLDAVIKNIWKYIDELQQSIKTQSFKALVINQSLIFEKLIEQTLFNTSEPVEKNDSPNKDN